jgi:hypothetical protein
MNEKLIEHIKNFDGVTSVTEIYCDDPETVVLEIEVGNKDLKLNNE